MARKDVFDTDKERVLRFAQQKAERSMNLDSADALASINYIYLNPAQLTVYNFRARTTTVEAGRGTGKTDGLISPHMVGCVQSMPRGSGLFLGVSIKQLFTKTVPNTLAAIERNTGLKEGVHFVRGHAPKKLQFKEPLVRPRVWENCIHFWNGHVYYMISTSTKAASNGMNVCEIDGDEARFMPESIIKSEILPTLRGINTTHPGFDENSNPYYKSLFLVSDSPFTRRQSWMRKRKDEQTYEVNCQIAEMIHDAQVCPEIVELPEYQQALNRLRCQSSAYFSFSSFENWDILGEQFIRKMKQELTPTMFDVAIRNAEKERVNDGYYVNFNPDVHTYMNSDDSQIEAAQQFKKKTITQVYSAGRSFRVENEAVDFNEVKKASNCWADTDIVPGEPLRIALDYGALINCLVVGQTPNRRNVGIVNVLKSFTNVKATRLEGLMGDFCKYYEPHRSTCPDVFFYYDSTARQGGSYAIERSDETKFYNVVISVLKKHGWNVIKVPMGRPMSHEKKYELINGCLAGTKRPFIRINAENNEFLIASIENAGVKETANGFMKDKGHEKDRVRKDIEDVEAELSTRTDLSDAFDTLIIGVRDYQTGSLIGVGMPVVRTW